MEMMASLQTEFFKKTGVFLLTLNRRQQEKYIPLFSENLVNLT